MSRSIATTVKDLMSENIISLHPKDKMSRVKEIFDRYEIHHIPILVDNNVVGIISRSDYLRIYGMADTSFDQFVTEKVLKLNPVEMYMLSEVVCCDTDTPIENVIDLFLANAIHSVLVVKEKKLLGIVTPSDLLRLLKEKM